MADKIRAVMALKGPRHRAVGVKMPHGGRVESLHRLRCTSCGDHCTGGAWVEQEVTVYPKLVAHVAERLEGQCEKCATKTGRRDRIEKKTKH